MKNWFDGVPDSGIQDDGSGADHVPSNESGAVVSIDSSHFYLIQFTFHPVDFLPNPVYC